MSVGAMLSNGLALVPLDGGGGHLVVDGDAATLGILYDDRVAPFVEAVGMAEGETFVPPPETTRKVPAHPSYEPEGPTWLAHGLYLVRVDEWGDSLIRGHDHQTLGTVFRDQVGRFVEVVGLRDAP